MAGLTKQHFNKIANLIKEDLFNGVDESDFIQGRDLFIDDLSDYFKTQNPNFDIARFKEACLK